MVRGIGLALAGALGAAAAGAALAQGAKRPASPPERAASIYGGASVNGRDVDFEGDVRLTFRGGALVAASLDACTSTDPTSGVSDRFKTALAIKGNELTGSGTTDVGHQPFTVALRRGGTQDSLNLAGRITVGDTGLSLDAQDVDLQPAEEAAPAADEAAPGGVPTFNVLSVRVPLARERAVLDQLRGDGASLSAFGVVPSCADMRAGASLLEATVDPAKAGAVLAHLNGIEGVQARMSEISEPTLTVKIPGGQAGQDADIVAAVTGAVTAATGGTPAAPAALDPRTGTYRLDVRRDTAATRRLGLAEQLTSRFLIGRAAGAVYVNLSSVEPRLVDPAAQGLSLSDDAAFSEEGASQTGANATQIDEAVLAKLARDLKGQVWDGEKGAWK